MQPSDISRWQGSVDSWLDQGWVTAGQLINPLVNVIWADTGVLAAGYYDFTIMFCGTTVIEVYVRLEHRDAINENNLGSFIMCNPANKTNIFDIVNYKMVSGERLRLTNLTGLIGQYSGSIIYRLRA